VTMGKIAAVLLSLGDINEALRIVRDEELPTYERLGDVRSLVVGRSNLAGLYLKRNQGADRRRVKELLNLALKEAERLNFPEAQRIRDFIRSEGL
jgi:hypothetical protein